MSETNTEPESREGLSSITHGASLFFIGKLLSRGLKFVLNLILTRGLGASLYGIYAYAYTFISVAVILARAGTGKSLLRYIPEHEGDPARRNRLVGLAYLTAFVGSLLVAVSLYLLAPVVSRYTLESPLFVDVLRVFALVLPFNAAIKLTNAVFRGLEQLQYQVVIDDIVRPITQIGVVLVALAVGYSLLGVVAALALGTILISIIAISLLYSQTSIHPASPAGQPRSEVKEFYNYSIPLTFKDVGSILYNRIDIFMVGIFLAEASVGIYQIAVLVATILVLPLSAFNQLFPPVASGLYANDNLNELEATYETVTRWVLTIAIPPALIAGIYSAELLSVFGSEFTAGALVLTLFTVGQLTNCAVGPSGYLLMMTDHQYLTMLNQWLLGLLNVGLNYLFILEFGLIGAALATAGVLALINVLRVIEVWYTEGMTPYSITFWKPLAAGTLAGGVMSLLSIYLRGYVLLIGGGLVGGVVFTSALVAFGIEQDDREFFEEMIRDKLS